MKVKMTIEVELDDYVYGSSQEDILWLENEVLIGNGTLALFSEEAGDIIGVVKSVKNIQYP